MEEKKPPKQVSKFIRYTGIPLQMGLIIYLGNWLGKWIDTTYGNEDGNYAKVITLLAVFLSMYRVIKEVINISKEND